MRNPFRTERDAFTTVVVVGAVAVAVAVAVVLGGVWVAVGVFLALCFGMALAAYALLDLSEHDRRRKPDLRLAEVNGDSVRRIIVLANETLAGESLRAEILHRMHRRRTEVLVVAPALNSRLRHWTSDTDTAVEAAQERLDLSLSALANAGVEASGLVGADDPLQALEDALREFAADEVIISTHPPRRSHWLERELLPQARERFRLPITHVVVDLEHERAHGNGEPVETGRVA